jgi:hypothetical protein
VAVVIATGKQEEEPADTHQALLALAGRVKLVVEAALPLQAGLPEVVRALQEP